MKSIIPDISNELIIQRTGQGIFLARPEETISNSIIKIADLQGMPFHVYFMNLDSALLKFNERGAITFNLTHADDVIGRTVRTFASKESAERSIANDHLVANNKALLVKDELYTRLDQIDFSTLSFKFPWYDRQNKVVGIFGFSLLIDKKWGVSLGDSMRLILQTGLLEPRQLTQLVPGFEYNGAYLTQRQKEIIYYMIRGKTAKQIASILDLSSRTIEHYIENIKIKTNSDSKSELIDKMIDYFIQI
jgi:DNA-binding CsgD family transcriptional regulator